MARFSAGLHSRKAVLATEPDPSQPCYAAALLKLAMRLRKTPLQDPRDFDPIVEEVLGDLPVDLASFRGYLQRNCSFLLSALGQTHN
jgi:hypothetical protein